MENSHMTILCDRAFRLVFTVGKEKVVCKENRGKKMRVGTECNPIGRCPHHGIFLEVKC